MTKFFEYKCGCKFPIIDGPDKRIHFDLEFDNMNLECEYTWDIISAGNTKGVFQLESRFPGQQLSKKLKPRNIEELAALITIVRPGSSEAIEDGKSLTDRYIDRKNGLEPIAYKYPILKPHLEKTYGVMIYQEQALAIVKDIAGFTGLEAEKLRKAIGKKLPEEMARVEKLFYEKASALGKISDDEARGIFEWIKAGQRYSFNASHAFGYAYISYITAYAKAHFARNFFASYLYYAQEKQNPKLEVYELINNAKSMDIDVALPDIRYPKKRFFVADNKTRFGLTDIKTIGNNVYIKLEARLKTIPKPIKDWTWLDYLFLFSDAIPSQANEALINCGALDYQKRARFKMLYEYNKFLDLSDKELKWCKENYTEEDKCLNDVLKKLIAAPVGKLGGMANKNSVVKIQGLIDALENPPHELVDSAEWMSASEENYLGIAVSCSKVDDKDTAIANCSCREFPNRKDYCIIAAKIDEVRESVIKNGNSRGAKMGSMTVSDSTCSLSAVVFGDEYKSYKHMLIEGNTIMLCGEKSKKGDSMVVKKVIQI